MPKFSFDQDLEAFEQPEKARAKKRPWRRTSKGYPWGAQQAVNAFMRKGMSGDMAISLVMDGHIRATSRLGKSLIRHRKKLIDKYVAAGMSRDAAIVWAEDFMYAIQEKENYDVSGLVELFTYHRSIVDKEIVRGPGESVESAVARWEETRERVRERKYGR